MSDKLQEIKESLSTITSGKWNVEGVEIWKRGEGYNHEEHPHVYIGEIIRTENSEFIASAPVNISWLIEQLEQAQKENMELLEQNKKMYEAIIAIQPYIGQHIGVVKVDELRKMADEATDGVDF